jgi:hypothetical protein
LEKIKLTQKVFYTVSIFLKDFISQYEKKIWTKFFNKPNNC